MSLELFTLIPENNILIIPDTLRLPLKESLLLGKNISRFTGDDLPPHVINDNVHDHTLRLYHLASQLHLSPQLVSEIKTTVLIHDLPEIISLIHLGRISDLTAPEKSKDPILAQKVATEEIKIAYEIFTDQEMSYYQQLETASMFVSGQELVITPTGIFSKILDSLDANITLHHQLSLWAQSDNYNPNLLKPERSLTYCFRQYLDLTPRLHQHSYLGTDNLDHIYKLLEGQIFFIRQCWNHVPQTNIPPEIRPFI